MPFGDWLDLWYRIYSKPGLRITTQQCYEDRIYNHIIQHVGEIPLNKLTQSDLQQFYAELKRNGRRIRRDLYGPALSDRMVRSCHTTCRIALEKAKTEGLIRVNPAVGCKLPPKKAREMQVLSHEEMQRFLIQAKEDGFYEMMLLELATGMRRGEICALQWDDLNLRTGELHIQRQVIHVAGALHVSSPKTKSSDRVVILPPAVLAVLRELKERTDSRWMFPSLVKEDAPLDPQSVYRKMKKVLARAQCKNIHFHDLRHPYVKLTTKKYLLQKQKSQATVADNLGFLFLLYSKRSCTLYSISIRLSGYTRTLLIRRSASAAVRPVASSSSFEMLLRWASFSFASCSRFA
jgi:integrase